MDIEISDYDFKDTKIVMNKNGEEIECRVLFTYDSDETKKRYIAFTDDSIAPNGRKNIFVQAYNPFAPEIKLENITDEKELDMINEVLIKIDESSNQ